MTTTITVTITNPAKPISTKKVSIPSNIPNTGEPLFVFLPKPYYDNNHYGYHCRGSRDYPYRRQMG